MLRQRGDYVEAVNAMLKELNKPNIYQDNFMQAVCNANGHQWIGENNVINFRCPRCNKALPWDNLQQIQRENPKWRVSQ